MYSAETSRYLVDNPYWQLNYLWSREPRRSVVLPDQQVGRKHPRTRHLQQFEQRKDVRQAVSEETRVLLMCLYWLCLLDSRSLKVG